MMKIRFSEIKSVPASPGKYEIHYELDKEENIPLKVGIGVNLRKRLLNHKASRQTGLRLKPNGIWENPDDVISKSSIMAKHFFYDETIIKDYNLKEQPGRQQFLMDNCFIVFEQTETIDKARELERIAEENGLFRYV